MWYFAAERGKKARVGEFIRIGGGVVLSCSIFWRKFCWLRRESLGGRGGGAGPGVPGLGPHGGGVARPRIAQRIAKRNARKATKNHSGISNLQAIKPARCVLACA